MYNSKKTSIFALIFILSIIVTSCVPTNQASGSQIYTIAVVEEVPGETGNPNPQSIYAGVELAAAQFKEHTGIDVVIVPYADNGDVEIAKEIAGQIAKSDAVAVIGHSTIETSSAAAEIYDAEGIPVLNSVPVTEALTDEHPYYFNTIYTAETEAAYLANYLRKITGAETASIISTSDGYGQLLAKQFGNTFTGLGGTVTIERVVSGSSELELDSIIREIISAGTETRNPGTIFLATDDVTAAQLIITMKQKGVSYPVVGASSMSTTVFQELIGEQSEEKVFPGYYTEGVLTTNSIIFDSANRYASQFRFDYQTKYQADPGDRVVNGYDTALLLFKAFLDADIDGSDISIGADRQRLYRALQNIYDTESAVQGVVTPIYFEPSRKVVRAPRFGVYQNGRIVSANTQFEPIAAPNMIRNLDEQVASERIITVDGRYVYKANVIYAGIDLLGIKEIDIKTSTYNVDFYLWFRYRPNDLDEEFQPDDFVFTNAEAEPESVLIHEEENSDGTFLKTYRISGVFKNQFQFYDYPFDHQNLVVEFRNQNATTSIFNM
ncbi:MAG TPA: ABC transporter substrate-binding protein [Anaerolineales bacterium]|nr:ABC transporter substrate-binding protein [Anaerolineales bacterium]